MPSVILSIVWNYNVLLLLRLPHHFPLICAVDVSYENPPLNYITFFFSSQCMLIPYHINLLSCIFLNNYPTFAVPQIISFLILYGLVTPLIHLNILISATSNFLSCALFNAHVSVPYIIAGLTAVLHTFPLTLKLIHRSH